MSIGSTRSCQYVSCLRLEKDLHCKNRRVLMNAQRPDSIFGRMDRIDWIVQAKIPQSNFSISTSRHQLPHTSTLHMNVGNPLFVFSPYLHHGRRRLEPLIENTNCAVSKSCNEDVPCNLIGCQRGNARSGTCRNVLLRKVSLNLINRHNR